MARYLDEKAREGDAGNPTVSARSWPQLYSLPHDMYPVASDWEVERLRELSYLGLKTYYGDNPPREIIEQLEKELRFIHKWQYEPVFLAAHRLVCDSEKCGYLVGSRGCTGASLTAFLIGISEINPLPAHYRCSKCGHVEFTDAARCGHDLPDAVCPQCGTPYFKDGFDIPYERFFGEDGEERPDICINFSVEYLQRAESEAVELLGKEHRRLDILGIDVLTMLARLETKTGVKRKDIPFGDSAAMALFCSKDGTADTVETEDIFNLNTHERSYAREVIARIHPKTLEELIHVAGMIHGSGNWIENGEVFIETGQLAFLDMASTEADVMDYLLKRGADRKTAYRITERVRRGRVKKSDGFTDEELAVFAAYKIPDAYLEHIAMISYLQPRATQAAYTVKSYQLAWYKVHYPKEYFEVYNAFASA